SAARALTAPGAASAAAAANRRRRSRRFVTGAPLEFRRRWLDRRAIRRAENPGECPGYSALGGRALAQCAFGFSALGDAYIASRSSGTIQNALWPRATRWQLSKALRHRFGWLSHVGPAECGLKIAFFSVNSS